MVYFKIIRHLILAATICTVLIILFDLAVNRTINWSVYPYDFLSYLIICSVLSIYIFRNIYHGTPLLWRVAIVLYALGFFNVLIEALLFDISNLSETLSFLLFGIPITFASTYVLVHAKPFDTSLHIHEDVEPLKISFSKIILGSTTYFFLYAIAGIILYQLAPDIEDFYRDKLPPLNMILFTNLGMRGVIYVLVAYLILHSISGKKIFKAILTGGLFSFLGGIAPLIPPNDLMPGYVRLGHAIEVGVSNLLFGFLLTYLISGKKSGQLSGERAKNFNDAYLIFLASVLILGLVGMPGEYYFILKVILFPSLILIGIRLWKVEQLLLAVINLGFAVLFNPFIPLSLPKIYWSVCDLLLACLLIYVVVKNLLHSKYHSS